MGPLDGKIVDHEQGRRGSGRCRPRRNGGRFPAQRGCRRPLQELQHAHGRVPGRGGGRRRRPGRAVAVRRRRRGEGDRHAAVADCGYAPVDLGETATCHVMEAPRHPGAVCGEVPCRGRAAGCRGRPGRTPDPRRRGIRTRSTPARVRRRQSTVYCASVTLLRPAGRSASGRLARPGRREAGEEHERGQLVESGLRGGDRELDPAASGTTAPAAVQARVSSFVGATVSAPRVRALDVLDDVGRPPGLRRPRRQRRGPGDIARDVSPRPLAPLGVEHVGLARARTNRTSAPRSGRPRASTRATSFVGFPATCAAQNTYASAPSSSTTSTRAGTPSGARSGVGARARPRRRPRPAAWGARS